MPISASKASVSLKTTTCPSSVNFDNYLSQDEISSTDAGEDDDIHPVFVDFSNSDSEQSDDFPDSPSVETCVFSVMFLLRLRSSICADADVPPAVRYSTRSMSELEDTAPAPKQKCSPKAGVCASPEKRRGASSASWRQPLMKLPEAGEDSWIVHQRKCTPDDDAKVVRAARSILNKLTIEKFEPLFEQLTSCGIQEPHHISILMREIFEKATIQHHFISMYADLCMRLEKDPSIAAVVQEAGELHNFRRLLLNQCQVVFEQVLEPSCNEDENNEVDEEMIARRKERALGNMKLIGQLLVNGMLSSDLFVVCCQELLRNRTKCLEALEALVALINVAGPKFDTKSWQSYNQLEKVFEDMKALTKDKPTPPRLRFLIRDVLDAREAGWPSSNLAKTEKKPKTDRLEQPKASNVQKKNSNSDSLARLVELTNPKVPAKPWKPAKVESVQAKNQAVQQNDEGEKQIVSTASSPKVQKIDSTFDVVGFRRTLAVVLSDLATDKNVPAAVQRIRSHELPAALQANEYMDIITRIVEERRGAVRRCQLAFLAALVAGDNSAFDRKECLLGVKSFFQDVYNELCAEVVRLPSIMRSEFMPAMLNSFPATELNSVVPVMMQK